jgi:hypothetical protein
MAGIEKALHHPAAHDAETDKTDNRRNRLRKL